MYTKCVENAMSERILALDGPEKELFRRLADRVAAIAQ
jgi:hypothetical protein